MFFIQVVIVIYLSIYTDFSSILLCTLFNKESENFTIMHFKHTVSMPLFIFHQSIWGVVLSAFL